MHMANIITFMEETHIIAEQSAAGGWFISSCILLLLLFTLIDKLLKQRQKLQKLNSKLTTSAKQNTKKDAVIAKWRQARSMLQQTGIIRLRVKATPALPIIFISENISDLGYKAEELIAERTPFINMVHPDELNRLRSEVINFLNQGVTIYEQTFRIRNKNGGWRWVNDRIIVERDENGIPVALEGLLIDITEIKRLEEQLSKSKENYATLFHKIYDPVVIIDRETLTFIDVNNAAINAYGYTHEEFLQMVPKDLRSTDHYDSVNEQIAEFDFSKVQSCVHQIKMGDKIYVEIISTEGFYAGRPVYISTLRDVTHQHEVDVERRELIASVEQSREFLNTVLDAIPNPVYVKDT